ncbi:MAG: hypothetical protein MZW92_32415 [Comamonadaceae bacterium]|nr:hypothetical protein [Comamonadaceae bacterium]
MEGHLRLSYCRHDQGRSPRASSASSGRSTRRPRTSIYIGDTQAGAGTGYEQPARHQDARAGAGRRRSRATTGWTTTASSTCGGSTGTCPTEALYEEIVFRREGAHHARRRRSW